MTTISSTDAVRLRTVLGEHPDLLAFELVQRLGAPGEEPAHDVYYVPVPGRQIGSDDLVAYLRGRGLNVQDLCAIDLSALTRRAGRAAAPVNLDAVLAEGDADAKVPTSLECLLAVFCTTLLDRDSLRPSDNVFSLGAESIHADHLVKHIETAFQFDMRPHFIFDYPTIRGLAPVLSAIATRRDLEADAALMLKVLRDWSSRTAAPLSTCERSTAGVHGA